MNLFIQDIVNDLNNKLQNCYQKFIIDIKKLNFGRANPEIIKNLLINYNSNNVPLYKLSFITITNNNTIKITVYDNNLIHNIKKSIIKYNLGINPIIKNNNIYVIIPNLTLENKKLLKKIIITNTEKIKLNIRYLRKLYIEKLTNLFKNKTINKDEVFRIKKQIQKYTSDILFKIVNFIKHQLLIIEV